MFDPLSEGQTIKRWLRAVGRTQGWLAAQLATNQSTISLWLNGKPNASALRLHGYRETTRRLMSQPAAGAHPTAAVVLARASTPGSGAPISLLGTNAQTIELSHSHSAPPPSLPHPPLPVRARIAAPTATQDDDASTRVPMEQHDEDEEDSEGVQLLGERIKVDSILRTAPHARDQCILHPFSASARRSRCCELCYCVVCEVPAAACASWAAHCEASLRGPSEAHWRAVRRELAEANGTRKRPRSSIAEWLGSARPTAAQAAVVTQQQQQPAARASAEAPLGVRCPSEPQRLAVGGEQLRLVPRGDEREVEEAEDVKAAVWTQVTLRVLAESEPEPEDAILVHRRG
jgi:hypothetical protein